MKSKLSTTFATAALLVGLAVPMTLMGSIDSAAAGSQDAAGQSVLDCC